MFGKTYSCFNFPFFV